MSATRRLVPVDRGAPLSLSYGQQRLWFIDRLAPGTPIYNEPLVVVELAGALDLGAVRRVLDYVIVRHEPLRTVIADAGGEPSIRILDPAPAPLALIDLDPDAGDGALVRWLDEEALRPFDLARGPLVRFTLLRPGRVADLHVLVIGLHHIVSDGWSVRVLLHEIATLYAAAMHGEDLRAVLPPLEVQYADYAAWQRARVASGELAHEEAYWVTRLRRAPTHVDWPPDRPSDASGSLDAGYVAARVSIDAVDHLLRVVSGEVSRGELPVTRFMILLAVWLLVLQRRTGATDLVVVTAVAGRSHRALEPLIGFFVNVLALRTSLAENPTFRALVERVRETVIGALVHQELPFDHLVERLRPDRRDSRQPLANVFFSYHNFPRTTHEVEGLRLSRLRHERGGAKFDVALLAVEQEEDAASLTLQLWYDAQKYGERTIRAALAEVCRLVEGLDEATVAHRLLAIERVIYPAEERPW